MIEPILHRKPAVYRIRIQGILGVHWTDYMNGLEISVCDQCEPPETLLYGEIDDQGALIGVLTTLYDMGFNLLSVECEGQG